jgi:RimJ/RimL family protein N-acetyltransferase
MAMASGGATDEQRKGGNGVRRPRGDDGVTIARLDAAHAHALHRLAADRSVRRALWDDDLPSLDEVVSALEQIERARDDGYLDLFAVLDVKGAIVGICRIDRDREDERVAEIGYFVAEPFQGRGYATVAVARLLARAFLQLSITRVVASCEGSNAGSRRVLDKVGFRPCSEARDGREDVLTFELEAQAWLASSDSCTIGTRMARWFIV